MGVVEIRIPALRFILGHYEERVVWDPRET